MTRNSQFIYTLLVVLISNPFVFGQDSKVYEQLKPRVVVFTDVSTWETDDQESLVRFFAHADLFEIEAIMFTTGWSHGNIAEYPEHMNIIYNVIDAYEKDLHNLQKRSKQTSFAINENAFQKIGYWPSSNYIRERTMRGSLQRGVEMIGEDNDSEGSDYLIELADEDDDRPIWITVWGGGNTLAQAVWKVQQNRSAEELKTFLNKLRVYTITDQDRAYDGSEGFEISAHQWLRKEFSEDLFFIWDECAWRFQNGTGKENWEHYEAHIQGHGHLGEQYPKYKYGVEGDTPAFLHILPNGLNNPEETTQAGWGGYSEWGVCPDDKTYAFTNHSGTTSETCFKYERYFYPATFNNFVARMDWAAKGTGNKNPIAILDGDSLAYKWWIMRESGSYTKDELIIEDADSSMVEIQIPLDTEGSEFHVILEITDTGAPSLTSYRRIIFEPKR